MRFQKYPLHLWTDQEPVDDSSGHEAIPQAVNKLDYQLCMTKSTDDYTLDMLVS